MLRAGQTVRKLRTARAVSQEELAAVMTWSLGTLRGVEQGVRDISLKFAADLAEALHKIGPLTPEERRELAGLGVSAPILEQRAPSAAPTPAPTPAPAPAEQSPLGPHTHLAHRLLLTLGPAAFQLWLEASLATAEAIAQSARPAPGHGSPPAPTPAPRLTSEETDPVTGQKWLVRIADPSFTPLPSPPPPPVQAQAPAAEPAKDAGRTRRKKA